MKLGSFAVGLGLSIFPFSPLYAQIDTSLDELDETRTAIGVGIVHRAAFDQLYAVGTLDQAGRQPVDSATTFRAPALTRVLIAMSARALAASGQIDLDEAIGGIVPGLDPAVGRITLRQLLHHASGLDDAQLYEHQTWGEAIGALDEHAFVLPPGEATSYSRYSYPLATRVLEELAGASIADIAHTLILAPLGLTSTRLGGAADLPTYARDRDADPDTVILVAPTDSVLGLPVAVTSAPDLLALSAAWMDGGIPGSTPLTPALLPPDRRAVELRDGMRRTASGIGATLSTGALRWVLLPATGTASVRWTTGDGAARTDFRVDGRMVELSGLSLRVPPADPPTEASDIDPDGAPFDFGVVDDWAGTYRNGSVMFELRNIDGRLHIWDGNAANPMRHAGDGVLELDREGFRGATVRVARIGTERVAFYHNLVYRLEGPPPG